MTKVFLHLLDDVLFVQRVTDKRVNPIEFFRWQFGKRNGQVVGYCPLGRGKVNIPAILDMMDGRKTDGRVMVELDSPPPQVMPAIETAKIAKAYLQKQGVVFSA